MNDADAIPYDKGNFNLLNGFYEMIPFNINLVG